MSHELKQEDIAMLRREIELLIGERACLLKVAGAAAAFIAELDSSALPTHTYEAADVLAQSLNALRDETLKDALEAVQAHLESPETCHPPAGAA